MLDRSILTRKLKQLWAAHHYIFHTHDIEEIAKVVNVSVPKLQRWMKTPYWEQALAFWSSSPNVFDPSLTAEDIRAGDFKLAYQVWTDLIEKGEL